MNKITPDMAVSAHLRTSKSGVALHILTFKIENAYYISEIIDYGWTGSGSSEDDSLESVVGLSDMNLNYLADGSGSVIRHRKELFQRFNELYKDKP